jgi:hypothetical protein
MARALRVPGQVRGRAQVPRPATTGRRPARLPSRRLRGASRPWPATATAARRVRRLPKPPPRAAPPRSRTPRPGRCRLSRSRPHRGPRRLRRGRRMPRLTQGRRVHRRCPDRPGLRPAQPISAAREPGRAGPRPHVPARPAVSVPAARVAVRTRPKVARVPAQVRRDPVRPGPALPAPVRVPRVPVPGRATTHSARPRPAWARHPRPGRRLRAPLVPRGRVRDLRAVRRALPAAHVPPDAVPGVPVKAVRVLVVRVLVAPGRAR